MRAAHHSQRWQTKTIRHIVVKNLRIQAFGWERRLPPKIGPKRFRDSIRDSNPHSGARDLTMDLAKLRCKKKISTTLSKWMALVRHYCVRQPDVMSFPLLCNDAAVTAGSETTGTRASPHGAAIKLVVIRDLALISN